MLARIRIPCELRAARYRANEIPAPIPFSTPLATCERSADHARHHFPHVPHLLYSTHPYSVQALCSRLLRNVYNSATTGREAFASRPEKANLGTSVWPMSPLNIKTGRSSATYIVYTIALLFLSPLTAWTASTSRKSRYPWQAHVQRAFRHDQISGTHMAERACMRWTPNTGKPHVSGRENPPPPLPQHVEVPLQMSYHCEDSERKIADETAHWRCERGGGGGAIVCCNLCIHSRPDKKLCELQHPVVASLPCVVHGHGSSL